MCSFSVFYLFRITDIGKQVAACSRLFPKYHSGSNRFQLLKLGNCFTFPILQLGNCFTFPKEIRHRCHFMNYLNIKKPEDSASDVLEEETSNGRDPSIWHIGLKVAWDIKTSGLAIPLHPGDCYFMLDDLNMTHQHCVLAGLCPRFSSTHRVAECSRGTLHCILGQCNTALQNMPADLKDVSLQSLDVAAIKLVEETHNELHTAACIYALVKDEKEQMVMVLVLENL
uniref:Uncharacterized protein n=1 Tax=Sphaerodactylus townsendi TaxID=933632 RepID=A0ACB8EA89_9SAUR